MICPYYCYHYPRTANNVIEAASAGASTSIKLVANVAVNVMAFLAILEFLNATLIWLGDRCGVDGLSFQVGQI